MINRCNSFRVGLARLKVARKPQGLWFRFAELSTWLFDGSAQCWVRRKTGVSRHALF
jgi:hypothetical protein